MKLTTLTISSSRKVPHPGVDFANLNSYVSLTATLDPEDVLGSVSAELQDTADAIVEMHIERLVQRHTPQPRPVIVRAAEATANTASDLARKHGVKK